MLIGILWLICSVAIWVLYHKLFDVIYFDFSHGCLKELIICAIGGAILTGGIIAFWYIANPIVIIIISVILYKKNH